MKNVRENEGMKGLPKDPSPFSGRANQMASSNWSFFLFGIAISTIKAETFLFYAFMHCVSLDLRVILGSPIGQTFFFRFLVFLLFLFFISPFF